MLILKTHLSSVNARINRGFRCGLQVKRAVTTGFRDNSK